MGHVFVEAFTVSHSCSLRGVAARLPSSGGDVLLIIAWPMKTRGALMRQHTPKSCGNIAVFP